VTARYAIFYVPADDSALGRFGNEVLGRDAHGHKLEKPQSDHPQRMQYVAGPAHYGFHATLKAPFELAPDTSVDALQHALADKVSQCAAIKLHNLQPRALAGFCALVLPERNHAVDALAADCVKDFERFRAPLSPADIERRNPARLSAPQRDYLQHYGYPFVLDEFRFHMTLSSPVAPEPGYLCWLQERFKQTVTDTPSLDRLALCWQVDRTEPFRRLSQWRLTGASVS